MLTKPKRSYEQCMSLSHSQVWWGFKEEDRDYMQTGYKHQNTIKMCFISYKVKRLIS